MVDYAVENILAVLAERKIAEAMEEGVFDNLPGKGKPLPDDELANLPDDVRLAFRILKMSGMTVDSDEAASGKLSALGSDDVQAKEGKVIHNILETLDITAPEEGNAYRHLESLRARLGKNNPLSPDDENKLMDSGYLDKIMQKLFPEKKQK
jgi:hypothetical protein